MLRSLCFAFVLSWAECKWRRTYDIENCPAPPDILNAFPMQEVWDGAEEMKQAFLSYKCEDGYSHTGDNSIYCLKKKHDFVWSKPTFVCSPISCTPPIIPKNGKILGENFTFGEFISFECRQGFNLYSSDGKIALSISPLQVCTRNGTWSGEVPQCLEILCPSPDLVSNGIAKPTTREIGGELITQCNKGFTKRGGTKIICSLDGKWEGDLPSCIPKIKPKPVEVQKLNSINLDGEMGFAEKIWKKVKNFFNQL